jgi:hypothetical protein
VTSSIFRFGAGLAAAALAAIAAPAQAYDFPCFEDDVVQSARIHDLRVMLMVSSLKCRMDHPATLREYGRLLDQRADEFNKHGQRVESSLIQRYGERRGKAEYHTYNTTLSNYHSQVQPTDELCNDASAFIKLARRASYEELETLSKLMTNRSVRTCPAPARGFVPAVAGSPAIGSDEAVPAIGGGTDTVTGTGTGMARPAREPDAPEIVDGVPTYSQPGTAPDTRPEPLETVSVPAAEAQGNEGKSEEARLEAAISALDAAADALRDLRAPQD